MSRFITHYDYIEDSKGNKKSLTLYSRHEKGRDYVQVLEGLNGEMSSSRASRGGPHNYAEADASEKSYNPLASEPSSIKFALQTWERMFDSYANRTLQIDWDAVIVKVSVKKDSLKVEELVANKGYVKGSWHSLLGIEAKELILEIQRRFRHLPGSSEVLLLKSLNPKTGLTEFICLDFIRLAGVALHTITQLYRISLFDSLFEGIFESSFEYMKDKGRLKYPKEIADEAFSFTQKLLLFNPISAGPARFMVANSASQVVGRILHTTSHGEIGVALLNERTGEEEYCGNVMIIPQKLKENVAEPDDLVWIHAQPCLDSECRAIASGSVLVEKEVTVDQPSLIWSLDEAPYRS